MYKALCTKYKVLFIISWLKPLFYISLQLRRQSRSAAVMSWIFFALFFICSFCSFGSVPHPLIVVAVPKGWRGSRLTPDCRHPCGVIWLPQLFVLSPVGIYSVLCLSGTLVLHLNVHQHPSLSCQTTPSTSQPQQQELEWIHPLRRIYLPPRRPSAETPACSLSILPLTVLAAFSLVLPSTLGHITNLGRLTISHFPPQSAPGLGFC